MKKAETLAAAAVVGNYKLLLLVVLHVLQLRFDLN